MTISIPYKALYAFDNKVLLYRKGNFYISENGNIYFLIKSPLSFAKRIAAKTNILNRLMRLEPRAIEKFSNNLFVMSFEHKIWVLDIEKKTMHMIFENRPGWSNPLNFCSDGNNVYWGEYGGNSLYESVNIYKADKNSTVSIVHTFPKGTIRHIHNIIYDKEKQHFWIFTGDNEEKAGIYTASMDWQKVEPIKTGEQKYRAVVGFPYKDGLIYATDAVSDINKIYILSANGSLKELSTINGSCIYGTEIKNHYIFSTTVEPIEGRSVRHLFTYKLGAGILSRDVHLIAVNKTDLTMKIIARYKKDRLPMKLFQYGAISFPKGQDNSNGLWSYTIACKKTDGKSIYFSDIK